MQPFKKTFIKSSLILATILFLLAPLKATTDNSVEKKVVIIVKKYMMAGLIPVTFYVANGIMKDESHYYVGKEEEVMRRVKQKKQQYFVPSQWFNNAIKKIDLLHGSNNERMFFITLNENNVCASCSRALLERESCFYAYTYKDFCCNQCALSYLYYQNKSFFYDKFYCGYVIDHYTRKYHFLLDHNLKKTIIDFLDLEQYFIPYPKKALLGYPLEFKTVMRDKDRDKINATLEDIMMPSTAMLSSLTKKG